MDSATELFLQVPSSIPAIAYYYFMDKSSYSHRLNLEFNMLYDLLCEWLQSNWLFKSIIPDFCGIIFNTCKYVIACMNYCIEMLGNACSLLNGYLYCWWGDIQLHIDHHYDYIRYITYEFDDSQPQVAQVLSSTAPLKWNSLDERQYCSDHQACRSTMLCFEKRFWKVNDKICL